jgi:periplasmic protein TonB
MSAHVDILDQPQPMARPFWGSLILHLSALTALAISGWVQHNAYLNIGSPTGGGIGGVMVNPVASIPLPDRGGPQNPVANPTESQVPTPPKAAPKSTPKQKAPPPNAIPLRSEKAPKRPAEAASQANKYREKQTYDQSQIYSSAGQRVSSPLYGIPGGGGVNIGDSSPFGQQFGYYATQIRDIVARNWTTADVNARSGLIVSMTFTIRRDGSVTNVNVSQSSGISPLDISAKRAVLDSTFPPLPAGFPKNQADVELKFELKR